jgi:hypothetical protein
VHPNDEGYQLIAQGFYEAFALPSTPEPACLSCLAIIALASVRRR